MTNLTNLLISQSYGDVLTTTNGGQGLSTTLKALQDGFGNSSPITIATTAVNFDRTGGNTFQLDAVAMTSTSVNINSVCQDNSIMPGTGGMTLPLGTTAERLANIGVLRYNTDTNTMEYFNGAWVGPIGTGTVTTITQAANIICTPNPITVAGTIGLNPVLTGLTSAEIGDLLIIGNSLEATLPNDEIDIRPTGTGSVRLINTTNAVPLRWYNAAGTFYTSLQAPALAANVSYVLPLAQGGAGDVLSNDGAGNLSWAAAGAGAVTSVSGTLNRITSTGGTTPIIDISAAYVGQASITTLGTIATGVWQGTPVGVIYGGTGLNSTTQNQILYSSAANTIAGLATANDGTLITSAGGVPSISSTLPTAVQDNITRVGALVSGSLAAGFTPVTVPLGGTGNNTFTAYSVICAGTTATGTFQNVVGVGTAGFVLTSNGAGALPTWQAASGGTVTSVSGTLDRITSTGGTTPVIDIAATYVGQTSITTLGTIATGTWQATVVGLTYGGTNAALVASNGGIFYSTATQGAILAGTATANQVLLSGSTAAPSWSTATYPATTTANNLLYSSATNTIANLATANNGVLITSAGGVPSISSTLPTAVQGNITGTGALASGSLAAGFTTVTVALGGTGVASTTAYAVLCGGTTGTGALQSIASVGTAGEVLTSNGAGALPTFQAAGGVAAASQAEMETGSSTTVYVSPGRAQYHNSASKSWVLFTSVTTTAITVSYNVGSLTDNGTGDTTVNFTTAFSTGNYSFAVGVLGQTKTGSSNQRFVGLDPSVTPTTSAFRMYTYLDNNGVVDTAYTSAVFYGDQ